MPPRCRRCPLRASECPLRASEAVPEACHEQEGIELGHEDPAAPFFPPGEDGTTKKGEEQATGHAKIKSKREAELGDVVPWGCT